MVSIQKHTFPYILCQNGCISIYLHFDVLIVFSIPEDELLLLEKLCLGSDTADAASPTDFLPELHPKSQPGFFPTIPVTGFTPLPAQNHLKFQPNCIQCWWSHQLCYQHHLLSIFPTATHMEREPSFPHQPCFPGLTDRALLAPFETHVFLSLCHKSPLLLLVQWQPPDSWPLRLHAPSWTRSHPQHQVSLSALGTHPRRGFVFSPQCLGSICSALPGFFSTFPDEQLLPHSEMYCPAFHAFSVTISTVTQLSQNHVLIFPHINHKWQCCGIRLLWSVPSQMRSFKTHPLKRSNESDV